MDQWERWLDAERYTGLSPLEVEAGTELIAGIRAALLREVGLRPGETVLELGCGTGEFLPQLLDAVGPEGTVLALDASPGLCGRAEAVLAAHPCGGRARVDQGDMRALPQAAASVDAVLCRSVLQYAEYDLGTVAEEIARVLRPGGRLAAFEILTGDGTPLLPVARSEAARRAHAEATARWRGMPWSLSRAHLSEAFRPPLFCPVTVSASLTEWRQPFSAERFAGLLTQVPRPGCPTLAEVFTGGMELDLREGWEALLADATDTAQLGAWAYLSAHRAPA